MAFRRTVTVPDDLELTDGDRGNIAEINKGLQDYGRAVFVGGDMETFNDFLTTELIYDPRAVAEMDANRPGANASAYAWRGKIFFGTGRIAEDGTGPWTRSKYGASDGSMSYANATFLEMSGRSMRAWMIAHEFGYLHSGYAPVPGNPWTTEVRANNFARKMTPHLKSASGTNPRVKYDP